MSRKVDTSRLDELMNRRDSLEKEFRDEDDEIDRLVRAYRDKLQKSPRRKFRFLQDELAEIRLQINAEQDRIDREITQGVSDSRIGKIFVRWKPNKFRQDLFQTNERAVCRAYDSESHRGMRLIGQSYNARPGYLVLVRLLKSGSDGRILIPFNPRYELPRGWFPEGVDPNKKRPGAK